MKYEVVWGPRAERRLGRAWHASLDRPAIAAAANWLDIQLARLPLFTGESRDSSVQRIAHRHPIGIVFEVVEDDKRVIVQGVFDLS